MLLLRQRKHRKSGAFFVGGRDLKASDGGPGKRGRKIDRSQCEMKGDFSSGSNLVFAERTP